MSVEADDSNFNLIRLDLTRRPARSQNPRKKTKRKRSTKKRRRTKSSWWWKKNWTTLMITNSAKFGRWSAGESSTSSFSASTPNHFSTRLLRSPWAQSCIATTLELSRSQSTFSWLKSEWSHTFTDRKKASSKRWTSCLIMPWSTIRKGHSSIGRQKCSRRNWRPWVNNIT